MASGWTDKGIFRVLDIAMRGGTAPANFHLALCTSATAPTKATNTLSQLMQIATGNGYVDGGPAVARSAVGFDVLNEADPVVLQLADVIYTASTGPLPASGSGARYAALTDANATVGNREVYAWFDLASDRTVSDGQSLTIEDAELQGDLP